MTTERSGQASQSGEVLSSAGIARRAAMLAELDTTMARRNIRRRAVRVSGVASLVIVVALFTNRGHPGVSTSNQIVVTPPSAPAAPALIQMVETDSHITSRLSSVGSDADTRLIGDAELQSMLREVGQPDGLVRVGGRTLLANEVIPSPHEGEPSDAG